MNGPIVSARHHDGAVQTLAPRPDDLADTAAWLAGRIVRTPVVRSQTLDGITGARLWLKAENLQRGGSFKIRGALRAVGRLAAAGGCRGVVTQSTGNHGIAVAMAARDVALPALVVLPRDASPAKLAAVTACGADVVHGGRTVDERAEIVRLVCRARGYSEIDAFDDPDVIAGQATATLELLQQADELGGRLEAVVVPVGGGSGIAGACLAVQEDGVDVYGVEPLGCDSMTRSLAAGQRIAVPPAGSLADGLTPTCVGELPLRIAREGVTGMVQVDDGTIGAALTLLAQHAKLIVEPSAAAALAGALTLADRGYRDIGVLLTGGNVNLQVVSRLLAQHEPAEVTP